MLRREFFAATAGGALAATCGTRSDLRPATALQDGHHDPARLADALLKADRADVVGLGLQWSAAGASPRDLLGAALLAGTRTVDPSPIGGQVHAMMMVASASAVTARLRGDDVVLPALFNLDRVKNSQARDAARGDWEMPPAPEADARPLAELTRDFAAAMTAWDAEAADTLAVALHARCALPEFFELIWTWAARDFRVIGHKAIYAAQAARALHDLGWRHGRDVVRSVLRGILDQNPYGSTPAAATRAILDLHPANLARADSLRSALRPGTADPTLSRELAAALRDAEPDAAAEQTLAAARSGASAATLWDAQRLRAFEFVLRLPTVPGVHPVTTVNALRHIARVTTSEAMPPLALLQAASWVSLFTPLLARADASRRTLTIDTVVPGEAGDAFTPSAEADRRSRAARQLADGGFSAFAEQACVMLTRKAREDHDYKFAAAALEEIEAAAPALQPGLAGAAMGFLHAESSAASTVFTRVTALRHG